MNRDDVIGPILRPVDGFTPHPLLPPWPARDEVLSYHGHGVPWQEQNSSRVWVSEDRARAKHVTAEAGALSCNAEPQRTLVASVEEHGVVEAQRAARTRPRRMGVRLTG